MQLSRPSSELRSGLAAATVALLGVAPAPARATEATSSALLYTEPNRVTAFETRADFTRQLSRERVLRYSFTLDALTGASPNGALRAGVPQTFTGPSGTATYRVAPGQTPLDDSFHDTRYAGSLSVDLPVGRLTTSTLGLNLSTERDYFSAGVSARLARDLFRRNTTIAIGVSGSADLVRPFGGTPDPFGLVSANLAEPEDVISTGPSGGLGRDDGEEGEGVPQGSEGKQVADALFGITQVLNRTTILQLNYSVSRATGYLTDPYKLITVAAAPGTANAGDPLDYRYESRPDTRFKQSLYAESKHSFGRDVLDVSYRRMWDDWGIRSHTFEGRYRLEIGEHTALEPQLRWYTQTAADFYRHSLIDGESLPSFASADTRLGAFDGWTGAVKYSRRLYSGHELGVRLGYYVQSGDSSPPDAFGSQVSQDLFPRVTAVMTQVSYSFAF
ncbi:MAG: DUF3570 domain-containing protein [bacterium]